MCDSHACRERCPLSDGEYMPDPKRARQSRRETEPFLKLSRSSWPISQGRLGVYERQELATKA